MWNEPYREILFVKIATFIVRVVKYYINLNVLFVMFIFFNVILDILCVGREFFFFVNSKLVMIKSLHSRDPSFAGSI